MSSTRCRAAPVWTRPGPATTRMRPFSFLVFFIDSAISLINKPLGCSVETALDITRKLPAAPAVPAEEFSRRDVRQQSSHLLLLDASARRPRAWPLHRREFRSPFPAIRLRSIDHVRAPTSSSWWSRRNGREKLRLPARFVTPRTALLLPPAELHAP